MCLEYPTGLAEIAHGYGLYWLSTAAAVTVTEDAANKLNNYRYVAKLCSFK